tara:strand:+ start:498 stop:662 length:165 start_codon:yes stop_codon:yes gene_type:complete
MKLKKEEHPPTMKIFRDMWDCVKKQFLELPYFWQFVVVCIMVFSFIVLGMIIHQ